MSLLPKVTNPWCIPVLCLFLLGCGLPGFEKNPEGMLDDLDRLCEKLDTLIQEKGRNLDKIRSPKEVEKIMDEFEKQVQSLGTQTAPVYKNLDKIKEKLTKPQQERLSKLAKKYKLEELGGW